MKDCVKCNDEKKKKKMKRKKKWIIKKTVPADEDKA